MRHVGLDLPHGGQRGLEPTRVLILLVKILSRVVLGGERVPAASRVPGRGPGSGVADADVSAVAAPGRSAPEAQCRASPRAAFLVEMAEQLTATVAGALLAALRAASGLERIAAGGREAASVLCDDGLPAEEVATALGTTLQDRGPVLDRAGQVTATARTKASALLVLTHCARRRAGSHGARAGARERVSSM